MDYTIAPSVFDFLNNLRKNNTREWMQENREWYLQSEEILRKFYEEVHNKLAQTDEIERVKIFRIHRDIRFRKDKTPYNSHRSVSFSRAGAHRRGGYYFRLDPGNCYMAGGFFAPDKEDLWRIRKEFEIDSSEIKAILEQTDFKKAFVGLSLENSVKSAPNGFDKTHPDIELIRLKSYVVKHPFSDEQVLASDFTQDLVHHFTLLRPFFDYMSSVLTTDLNGVSLLDEN